jgi:hypothetical protein
MGSGDNKGVFVVRHEKVEENERESAQVACFFSTSLRLPVKRGHEGFLSAEAKKKGYRDDPVPLFSAQVMLLPRVT